MQRLLAAVVHYGRLEPTLRTLAALRRTDPTLSVWVVDNQGREQGERPASEETGVERWLTPPRNLGYGRAINLVASEALASGACDLLLALNNDVELAEGALRTLVRELTREPGVAAATPRILRRDPSSGDPGPGDRQAAVWYDGGGIDWWRGTGSVPGAGTATMELPTEEPRDVEFVSGCVLLLRLEALREVGGFDPRYFLYEEDVELSLRLRTAGWRLRHVPSAVAYHLGQASQRRDSEPFRPIHHPRHPRLERLIELRVANRLLTARRHASGLDRLRFALGFPAYWSGKCLQAALAGRPRAFTAAARGVARFRRLRRLPSEDEVFAISDREEV